MPACCPSIGGSSRNLFQRKLLSVAVCTETLSAGINLPARSVVLPNILKGPPGKKRLLEPSTAPPDFRPRRPAAVRHAGLRLRAGPRGRREDRPLAGEVRPIPEDTKDPGLLRMKKDLKRKMPQRRENEQYWNEAQFEKLRAAQAGKLYSRGPLPWRLLAYMLDASPEVDLIRRLVGKRLMDSGHIEAGQRDLDRMLLTLWRAGYVTLEPQPPEEDDRAEEAKGTRPRRRTGTAPGRRTGTRPARR